MEASQNLHGNRLSLFLHFHEQCTTFILSLIAVTQYIIKHQWRQSKCISPISPWTRTGSSSATPTRPSTRSFTTSLMANSGKNSCELLDVPGGPLPLGPFQRGAYHYHRPPNQCQSSQGGDPDNFHRGQSSNGCIPIRVGCTYRSNWRYARTVNGIYTDQVELHLGQVWKRRDTVWSKLCHGNGRILNN